LDVLLHLAIPLVVFFNEFGLLFSLTLFQLFLVDGDEFDPIFTEALVTHDLLRDDHGGFLRFVHLQKRIVFLDQLVGPERFKPEI
jgi:hypothetical protein